jgi:small subunit ribosomal protein S3
MIERDLVTQKIKEFQIQEYIGDNLKGVGYSHTKIQRTPLGEKVIIFAARPGLIIGGGGSNIKKLTKNLKKEFKLENPQIEINEIDNVNIVAQVVAERIATSLEKYGTMRFKGIGHKAMSDVLNSGGLGIEIVVSGKIPSARARSWRFYQGYLKKCGDLALTQVDVAHKAVKLKSGIVGIKVSIMPPGTKLSDEVNIKEPVIIETKLTKEEDHKIQEEVQLVEELEHKSESKEVKNESKRTKKQK